jgi:3-phosphoshikimate 1-carboxyvinyltransferase
VNVTIKPSVLNGNITAPASKSSMQRACAAALLHSGTTVIQNPGVSNDDLAALDIIQKLGAVVVKQEDGTLKITGSNTLLSGTVADAVSCGESGLSIRMFTPIVALHNKMLTINGSGSLVTRPMHFFDAILPQLGVSITSQNGHVPLTIQGPLQPTAITIDGGLSSQFLTGLLFAFAKAATTPVTITVTNLASKPYIDLTLNVLKQFGYKVDNNNYESFVIHPKTLLADSTINYTVEGDWSGGAFLLVAGALSGNTNINGLDVFSTQADKAILKALMDSGSNISIEENKITFNAALGTGKAFHFNATDCPDLFPPLVALASYCSGTTAIEGANRLTHKESNRALTLQQEFAKVGVEIILQDDVMLVKGGNGVKGAVVHSRHDHRIAMACAVAALQANGDTIIEEAEAVNKSYPNFYQHLQLLNAAVSLNN